MADKHQDQSSSLPTRERNADDHGWVYVMQNPHAPHLVKIGLARDVRKRLSSARLYAPEMVVVGVEECDRVRTLERSVHEKLADARAYGQRGFHEWFYTDHPLVRDYLSRLQPYDDPNPAEWRHLPPPT